MANTLGQIALFDEMVVNDGSVKIVDVGASSFARFFVLVHELGFVHEAHRRALKSVVLFMADPDRRSMQAYADLQEGLRDIVLVPVYNGAVMRERQARERFPASQAGGVPVRITLLQPFLKAIIDRPGFSFDEFQGRPSDVETEMHAWIKNCFLEFRGLEMRLLLEDMRSTLQLAAEGGPATREPEKDELAATRDRAVWSQPTTLIDHPQSCVFLLRRMRRDQMAGSIQDRLCIGSDIQGLEQGSLLLAANPAR